jgi:WD40 repeat protein
MHRLACPHPHRLFTALLALLACLSGFALAGEPPTAPILRIDPAEHTARINRIATDAAGRWLVTASDDKTARVWDLKDGRLLSTLRPPLGAGSEGKLYAVAMSLAGETVAVGGWTGYEWDKTNSIYLFDRASGRLLRRITGLTSVIAHLTFSPDGRHLAATLGRGGLRLFDAADGRLLAEDRDYGDRSFSVHFRPDGLRLVTTSYDGQVRVYRWADQRLHRLASRPAPGGKHPYAARYAPDGQRIAVGFDDTAAVNVLDGEDLRLLAAPETGGVNGDLSKVAWSRDGRALFAAGQAQQNDQFFIRRWAILDNATTPQDWPVASNTIMDLTPLPDGRLVFGSQGPAWGVLTATGQHVLYHAPAVADFRNNWEGFTLAHDAAQMRFGYEAFGKSPALFDSASRSLSMVTANLNTAALSPPTLTAPGLDISGWRSFPPLSASMASR